jgi:hypothetical protein
MQEQTSVLVQHQDEWVLVTDDDEPERAWQNLDAAQEDLRGETGHPDGYNMLFRPKMS